MRKVTRNLLIAGALVAGAFVGLNHLAKKKMEDKSIDDDNPYFNASVRARDSHNIKELSVYEKRLKPALDKGLAFGGLVVLAPLFTIISLAIWLDDPGPVCFTQKRIGKDKHYVMIHKFRSMVVSTPHDVPTHQMINSELYITKVGKVLRSTSLDELPQIWDIFRGQMSVIGPRPALWNQEDLVTERDKYGANNVKPGLTGLAQIKGRDELEINDKAKLDGEYVKVLHSGGIKAFNQDIRCFINTIVSVVRHDGVVEGGTGKLSVLSDVRREKNSRILVSPVSDEVGFEDYGCYKKFSINKSKSARVLIAGAGSYIGEAFTKYCKEYYPNIEITTINMKDESWRNRNFEGFDTLFYVAGIAHADVSKVTPEQKKLYYAVNTELAIETARKAKESGVKQFIYMSSMIVYGEIEYIDEYTMPSPVNFYGDSKWQADKGVRGLASEQFKVSVLRSPMVYGKRSKGNYPMIARIAKKVPIFPSIENKRSMIYIENLCEFVAQLILAGEGGIYFPQNGEYSNTSEIVQMIGEVTGFQVHLTKLLLPAVGVAFHIPGKVKRLANKAFGSFYYSNKLSIYEGMDYSKISLKESIILTEG